jgi:hypothetical protein
VSDLDQEKVEETLKLFNPLYDDLNMLGTFSERKPLLAHYTSVQNLESILRHRQLWFSNPLLMNDRSELTFGMNSGMPLFLDSEEIKEACGTEHRLERVREALQHFFKYYDGQHVLDTYVTCFSEHESDDHDGLLSMWRAYGANGNGVALVFDTSKIPPLEEFPIVLAPVVYLRPGERDAHLRSYIKAVADILRTHAIADEYVYLIAHAYFERLKLFSLFTKHHGFKEEREWRAVYMPERDKMSVFGKMIDYHIGARGVEPKLKVNFDELTQHFGEEFTLNKIIHQILIGPTIAGGIQRGSMLKLLSKLDYPDLVERCVYSDIPFRG